MSGPSRYADSEEGNSGPEARERPQDQAREHPQDQGGGQFSDMRVAVELLRNAVIFFAVISYFVGWIYLNEYLRIFGLSLSNLDIPLYYVFVFSYVPLLDVFYERAWLDVVMLIILLAFILGCITVFKWKWLAPYDHARYPLFLMGVVLILLISFQLARQTGWRHGFNVLGGGGKAINFVFRDEIENGVKHKRISRLKTANSFDGDCLRLVWRSKETIYVVDTCDAKNGKPTYGIPVSAIVISDTHPTPEQYRP